MNDEEEVVRRLRELGARPVPDHVRARHLRALDSASGLLPVRRGRPNRRLLVGSIAAMSLVLVGAAAILARGDSPDREPVVITDDGGTTSDTPTTPSSTPTDRQQTPDQDEPAGPFSDDSCKGPPPFAGQHPLPPGASGRGEDPEAGRQAESDEWEDQKQDCPPENTEPTTSAPDASATDPGDDGQPPAAAMGVSWVSGQAVVGGRLGADPCAGPSPVAPGCSDPPVQGPSEAPHR